MSLRLPAALVVALLSAVLGAPSAGAGEFTDSAGRIVMVPPHVNKVMAAGPTAEVLIYVLAPDKLAGWTRSRRGLPARYTRLPAVGWLTGPNAAANVAVISRLHPDLIVDEGT